MALVYSCCFWFSLRLGGILIAICSILQSLVLMSGCCVAYSNTQRVKDSTAALINSMNLIYIRPYLENFQEDPEKYLSLSITFTSIYIFICLLFAYGAYVFKNILMIGYILLELLRLIFLTLGIITWLLVLKENTMDIGIQIGTSVAGTFFLLGMFYLWVCAANLPILINEMERDQQAATIHKLQQMLEINNATSTQSCSREPEDLLVPLDTEFSSNRKPIFVTAGFDRNKIFKQVFEGNLNNPKPFYSPNFNR